MILYFYKCNHLTASKLLQSKNYFLVLPPKTKIHTCNADYIIKREIALTKTDQLAIHHLSLEVTIVFWIFGFFTLAMKFLVVSNC